MKNLHYKCAKDADGNDYISLHFHDVNINIELDVDQLIYLLNHSKPFHVDPFHKYPYYTYNQSNINLFEYIHNSKGLTAIYKDNNEYNFRKDNIILTHSYEKIVKETYPNAQFVYSHTNSKGKDANIHKNPIWKTDEQNYVMYCEPNQLVYLDLTSFEIIKNKNITFFYCNNNYIAGRYKNKQYYIHQIIMNCFGNGKGTSTISVDHIDGNPLNNKFSNLRIVKQEIQQKNCKGIKEGTKRERKSSARPLPHGITQNMLEKYVVYYECYNKEKNLWREFFKIEKHPKLDKIWCSSKSNSISIEDKLRETNKVVQNLKNDIYPFKEKSNGFKLPKYVSLRTIRDKPCLVFEKRDFKNKRVSLKYTLSNKPNTQEELNHELSILHL